MSIESWAAEFMPVDAKPMIDALEKTLAFYNGNYNG